MATWKKDGVEVYQFGPCGSVCEEERAFWNLHEPVMQEWMAQMREAGDEWWQSAEHAAHCLASYRVFEWHSGAELNWSEFDVDDFLFHDLSEGGTVGLFGSVPIFYDHIVEAFERFLAAGIIDAAQGKVWLVQIREAKDRFLERYRDCEMEIVEVSGARGTLRANLAHERRD